MPLFKDNRCSDVIEHHSPIKGIPNITLTRVCIHCHQTHTFTMPVEDYRKWSFDRVFIQKAMPYFNADQREILISQTCPTCYNIIFKGVKNK